MKMENMTKEDLISEILKLERMLNREKNVTVRLNKKIASLEEEAELFKKAMKAVDSIKKQRNLESESVVKEDIDEDDLDDENEVLIDEEEEQYYDYERTDSKYSLLDYVEKTKKRDDDILTPISPSMVKKPVSKFPLYREWVKYKNDRGYWHVRKSLGGKNVIIYIGREWDNQKADEKIDETERKFGLK